VNPQLEADTPLVITGGAEAPVPPNPDPTSIESDLTDAETSILKKLREAYPKALRAKTVKSRTGLRYDTVRRLLRPHKPLRSRGLVKRQSNGYVSPPAAATVSTSTPHRQQFGHNAATE
jgi:hypothetical protein